LRGHTCPAGAWGSVHWSGIWGPLETEANQRTLLARIEKTYSTSTWHPKFQTERATASRIASVARGGPKKSDDFRVESWERPIWGRHQTTSIDFRAPRGEIDKQRASSAFCTIGAQGSGGRLHQIGTRDSSTASSWAQA
jgi:hypothetical protein